MLTATLLLFASSDVIVTSTGDVFRGEITAVEEDGIRFSPETGDPMRLLWAELEPNTAYHIRSRGVSMDDPAQRLALGDFCLAQGLYARAVREYEAVAQLDPTRRDAIDERLRVVADAETSRSLDRARDLMADGRWEEAARELGEVIQRHAGTAAAEEAAALLERVTTEVRAQIDARARALEDARNGGDTDSAIVERTRATLEQAHAAWTEGLDHEAAGLVDAADSVWQQAARSLQETRSLLEGLLADDTSREAAEAALGEVLPWLARFYNALGRLHAADRNYDEALRWVNETLKVFPDDPAANQLKLLLTEWRLRH